MEGGAYQWQVLGGEASEAICQLSIKTGEVFHRHQ